MVTTEEAIKVLDCSEDHIIINIQVPPAGFGRCYLMNDIDCRRPYRVIVDSSAPGEKQSNSIRVWMTSVVKTQSRAIHKALECARAWLNYGRIGIDGRGAVSLRYQKDIDLSLPQLVILLEKMTTFIRLFELQVTFYTMLDSGVHRTIVKQIMNNFSEWKNKSTKLFGRVL